VRSARPARAQAEGHPIQFQDADAENLPFPDASFEAVWIEVFRTYYGPMHKAFGALDAERQAAFTQDLLALMQERNRSGDHSLVLSSEYLEVVIERA